MRLSETLNSAVNVLVILLIGFLLFQPDGIVSQALHERRAKKEQRETINDEWTALANTGGRLDTSMEQVLLIEFSDYQCQFCKQMHGEIAKMLAETPGIGIVYRHFPLPSHHAANGAARASICAEAQGKFREMHNRLFESGEWEADTNWSRVARLAGVPDLEECVMCLSSQRTVSRLREDMELGGRLGVSATPTFITRGGQWPGAVPSEKLIEFARKGN